MVLAFIAVRREEIGIHADITHTFDLDALAHSTPGRVPTEESRFLYGPLKTLDSGSAES